MASTITADDATDTDQHDSLPDDINNSNIAVKAENENRVLNNFKRLLNAKAKQRRATAQAQPSQQNKGPVTQSVTAAVTNPAKIEKKKSTSRSSSSKDIRQDSLTSNWSENIPVIKISGTGSSECILENQESPQHSAKPRKIIHQTHVDLDTKSDDVPVFDDIKPKQTSSLVSNTTNPSSVNQKHSPELAKREGAEINTNITNNPNTELQIAEPQCASSSSETLTTIKVEELESLASEAEDKNMENTDNDLKKTSNNSDSTISTITSFHTKTESSTEYME